MKKNVSAKLLVLASFILMLPAAGLSSEIQSIVSTNWLLDNLNHSQRVILDVLSDEDHREGPLPGAFNLSTACAFNKDRTFKMKEELTAIVEAAAGKHRSKIMVTYCDISEYCPTGPSLITEVLDYTTAKRYPGSMQEWMQNPEAPIT